LKIFPNGRSFDSFSTGYGSLVSILANHRETNRTLAREIHKKHTDINIPVMLI
jgi:hypothetical protein